MPNMKLTSKMPKTNGGAVAYDGPLGPVVPVETPEMRAMLAQQAEIDRLKRENESLRAKPQSGLSLKISEKGALSVYGLGRFPVTLYREQWERLLAESDRIREYITLHSAGLKLKGQD